MTPVRASRLGLRRAAATTVLVLVGLLVAILAVPSGVGATGDPDGQRAPESGLTANGLLAFDSELNGGFEEIWLAHAVDGTHVRLSTEGGWYPSWSPDGEELAFVVARGLASPDVYRIHADGSGLDALTSNGVAEYSPDWSPDGATIAYERVDPGTGTSDVWVMNADGTGKEALTDDPANDSGPAFSPDGTKIAFTSDRDGAGADVYVMDADGSDVTRLTDDPGDDVGPEWSPDGTTIAFAAARDGGSFDLYTMDAEGGGEARLALAPGTDEFAPAWSPDGTKLALVLADPGGARRVAVVDADGTDLTPVTPDDFILGVDWQPVATADTVDPTVTVTRPATPGRVFERSAAPAPVFSCDDPVPGTGVRSCRADVTRPNGSIVEDLPPGDRLPAGAVGDYELRIEALDGALNRAVEVRPYTVVDHRPDGRIALGAGAPVGNDVYNLTGANQTRSTSAARGTTVTFNLTIQNDGGVDDQFRLRGQAEVAAYRVRYLDPGTGQNVTSDVTAGTFVTPVVAPGRSFKLQAVVTVRATAAAGSSVTRTVTATSTGYPSDKDVVALTVRRS